MAEATTRGAVAPEIPSTNLPPVTYREMPEALPLRRIVGPGVIITNRGVLPRAIKLRVVRARRAPGRDGPLGHDLRRPLFRRALPGGRLQPPRRIEAIAG